MPDYSHAVMTVARYLERWDPADEVAGLADDHPEMTEAEVVDVLRAAERLTVELRQDLRDTAVRARRAALRARDRGER